MNNKYIHLLHSNISHKPKTILLNEKDENIDMGVEIAVDLDIEALLFGKFDYGYVSLLKDAKKCDYVLFLECSKIFKIYLVELKNKVNTGVLKRKINPQISNGFFISDILKDHFNDKSKFVEVYAICIFNEDQIEEHILSEKIEISDEITDIELDPIAVDWKYNKLRLTNDTTINLLKIESKHAISATPHKINLITII